jgi:hypothetical protein
MEAVCDLNGYAYNGKTYTCDDGCENGACVKSQVSTVINETVTATNSNNLSISQNSITANQSEVNASEINETEKNYSCSGCKLGEECYPIGYILEKKFCDSSKEFKSKLDTGASCKDNFECATDYCISEKCTKPSLFKIILDWFKTIFGG